MFLLASPYQPNVFVLFSNSLLSFRISNHVNGLHGREFTSSNEIHSKRVNSEGEMEGSETSVLKKKVVQWKNGGRHNVQAPK